jgi:hypothetical protein
VNDEVWAATNTRIHLSRQLSEAILVVPKYVKQVGRKLRNRLRRHLHNRTIKKRLRETPGLLPQEVPEGAILVFAPEAGVTQHFSAMCIIGRILRELGHAVVFARCRGMFVRCPVMDAYRFPYGCKSSDRKQFCVECCIGYSLDMLATYGLPQIDLETFITQEHTGKIDQALAAAPRDLCEFAFDGVAFGRFCAMDVVLARKVCDLQNVEDSTRQIWLRYIEASLVSYCVTDRICQALKIRHLLHFNDYSMFMGARLAAEKNGVSVVGITQASHLNIDRRRYFLQTSGRSFYSLDLRQSWPQWRELRLTPAQVAMVGDDVILRQGGKGSHIYSPPKSFGISDYRTELGLAKDKRLLVAYTSSMDERLAGKLIREGLGQGRKMQETFGDQITWLHSLLEYVRRRNDVQLVVRIHPREGPNKIQPISSEQLVRLRSEFSEKVPNCVFIWPEDPISSYDLGEIADVVLISSSTIGLELARLGVPVLASTNGINSFPRDDFMEWGEGPTDYFERLEALLDRPMSLETIAHAFRWYHLDRIATSLDVGDLVPAHDSYALPPFRMPAEAQAIEDVILRKKTILDITVERQQAYQQENSDASESEALRCQLRRFIYFMIVGHDADASMGFISVCRTEEQSLGGQSDTTMSHAIENGNVPAIRLNLRGSWIDVKTPEKSYTRYSPLCARLGLLCESFG